MRSGAARNRRASAGHADSSGARQYSHWRLALSATRAYRACFGLSLATTLRCRVAASHDDVVYLVPRQSSAAKSIGERSRQCTAPKPAPAVEDLWMLPPDQGVELRSRLSVGLI